MLKASLWLGGLCAALFSHAADLPKVGLTVGQAHVVSAQGERKPLLTGLALADGSRIQTGTDAVVVLVFPDNARVSLRADSELVIRRYQIDPTGQDTQLELELVRGGMRQISGTASRAQPERYRLNTPMATIGVRGTDFLAQAQGQNLLQAFVHEGAIEVTPKDCRAACQPLLLASGAESGSYVRLHQHGMERRQLPLQEVEAIFGIGALSASGQRPVPAVVFTAGAVPVQDTLYLRQLQQAPATPAGPADPALPAEPASRQLVWGRFSERPELLAYQMLLPYAQAAADRHVTVGLLGKFALWRNGQGGDLDRSLSGRVDMRLTQGEAHLHQVGGGITPAAIQSAQLGLDFGRQAFDTRLQVQHNLAGTQVISGSGRFNSEGLFSTANATDRIAGAITRDGQEAGMLFARNLPMGTLQGVTLWGK